MARAFCLLFSTLILSAGHALAQTGTAIEIYPGITHYNSPAGATTAVEVFPGVRHFSGAVNGTAVEVYPGVTRYNFDSYQPIPVPPMQTAPARPSPDPIKRVLRYMGDEPRDQWIKNLTGQ